MAKKMVKYLAVMKHVNEKRVIYFPDFNENSAIVDSPEAAVISGLMLLKRNVDIWLETHDHIPKPKTNVNMTNFESCTWYPVAVDEAKIPCEDSENDTDVGIFTVEELEKYLGLDLQ